MELINATRMVAGYTMGIEPSGRELLVVVVKGTFRIPKNGEEVRLHEEQLPLVMADTFTGEPGFSAPMYEVDFAPRKHRCDVLLLGSAYAPSGRPTDRVAVGLRIGNWLKKFAVVGDRQWSCGTSGISATSPQPFAVKAFSYDVAFGGTDARHEDFVKHSAFMRNPIGRGFHQHLKHEWVDGAPLPNTEELDRPVDAPDGDYNPMSFGAVGRGWQPRSKYAGTYDQTWLDNVFPFLPADFDEAYFQAAPLDQQVPYLLGGEQFTLVNLSIEGRIGFDLPTIEIPVVFFPKKGEKEEMRGAIDTLVLEPNIDRFTLTWRVTRPLKRNMFEMAQVLVGRNSRAWWRARELGKDYYPSLAALANARRKESAEA